MRLVATGRWHPPSCSSHLVLGPGALGHKAAHLPVASHALALEGDLAPGVLLELGLHLRLAPAEAVPGGRHLGQLRPDGRIRAARLGARPRGAEKLVLEQGVRGREPLQIALEEAHLGQGSATRARGLIKLHPALAAPHCHGQRPGGLGRGRARSAPALGTVARQGLLHLHAALPLLETLIAKPPRARAPRLQLHLGSRHPPHLALRRGALPAQLGAPLQVQGRRSAELRRNLCDRSLGSTGLLAQGRKPAVVGPSTTLGTRGLRSKSLLLSQQGAPLASQAFCLGPLLGELACGPALDGARSMKFGLEGVHGTSEAAALLCRCFGPRLLNSVRELGSGEGAQPLPCLCLYAQGKGPCSPATGCEE
mmetsp:Transcript_91498/g.293977  ORF Transcript_91498/g.293977 Transcript_91498/m.293977 type:complete len:366 (+) Transcript_91498:123-1220(+)